MKTIEIIEPNKRYRFQPDFERALIRILTDMENAKSGNGHSRSIPQPGSPDYYKAKAMAAKPPTPAQMEKLRSLGSTLVPMNRWDASCMIDELIRATK